MNIFEVYQKVINKFKSDTINNRVCPFCDGTFTVPDEIKQVRGTHGGRVHNTGIPIKILRCGGCDRILKVI